jgi:endonuclease-3
MDDKRKLIDKLKAAYPMAQCELNYGDVFQLLVAVILSAQCTDKRVNAVTEELFKVYSTPQDFASANIEDLEKRIFSCGFYHSKAKSIIACAKEICSKYDGVVPDDFDVLTTLPGVGRKTANVMLSEAFKRQAIAVDTHVFRTSNRLKLSEGKTPYEVEMGLRQTLSPDEYTIMHHVLIFHGRYTCKSQRPSCGSCPVADMCDYNKNQNK